MPASIAACGIGEIDGLLVEVPLRRGAYPVRVATEVHRVEVTIEDLVFV